MSEEPQPLHRTIHLAEPGAWYWLAATFPHIIKAIEPGYHAHTSGGAYGALYDVTTPIAVKSTGTFALVRSIGRIAFNRPGPGDAPATAVIMSDAPEYDTFWEQIIDRLQAALSKARALRRAHEGVSTAEAIEIYYRARARGNRITLGDLAEQYNLPLGALKTAKRRYDAAGKWGSKKET